MNQKQRPQYRERQVLQAADMAAEQDYRVEQLRSHQIAAHGHGIARGLHLTASIQNEIQVDAGLAYDAQGRELYLPTPESIDPERLDNLGARVDVWLARHESPQNTAKLGRYHCGPGYHDRVGEESFICCVPALDEKPRPPVKPEPVYLGRLQRAERGWFVTGIARAIHATGASITDPLGTATLAFSRPTVGGRKLELTSLDTQGEKNTRLSFTPGQLSFNGSTKLSSWLSIQGALHFDGAITPPEEARANSAYLAAGDQGDSLRVEVHNPGKQGDPTASALDLQGASSALRVQADGTVRVFGDLRVDGALVQGPIEADPNDPRFEAGVLQGYLDGINQAGSPFVAEGTTMSVAMEGQTFSFPGADYSYTVDVANTGQYPLDYIGVTGNVVHDGNIIRQITATAPGGLLQVGLSRAYKGDFTVSGVNTGDTITVNFTVIAYGPALNPVQESLSQDVDIVAIPA